MLVYYLYYSNILVHIQLTWQLEQQGSWLEQTVPVANWQVLGLQQGSSHN